MKRYLLYSLLFSLLISCNKKKAESVIPEDINRTWVHILEPNPFFQKKCEDFILKRPEFVENGVMVFYLMSDEWEKVKKVIPTDYGYRIVFKDFRFDAEYRFHWVDKERRIARWEYFNNSEDPTFENFSSYTIDSINYHKLPPPPCIECFSKEECDKMK